MNNSTDYFFRVKASDRAELRRVLKAINVMENDPDVGANAIRVRRPGDAWYEVGRIENWQNPGTWVKEPISGEAYWHYNLRTSINVRRRIKQLLADPQAPGYAEAALLDQARGRWFSVVAVSNTDGVTSTEDGAPLTTKTVWL